MKQTLLNLTLALSSFVAMGQTKQNFELIPFDHNYHLMFSTGDESGNISFSHDDKGIVTLSFGEISCKGTIINHKLILAKPYVLSYDTCRQAIAILNTKAKKSYSLHWFKQPIYLTHLTKYNEKNPHHHDLIAVQRHNILQGANERHHPLPFHRTGRNFNR